MTQSSSSLDLPIVYKYHVFACFTKRPPGHPRGSCMENGAQPLWDRLARRLDAERNPDVCMTSSGCLGFCRAGPLMVVYPEGIWYHPETVEDIDEIVEKHFKGGAPVERLIIVPNP
ncbi:(2Fe-2S) ferredoxin domain-containing protein [Methylocella sp.]|uniref:(2Fe-2S) ferredoxin domain-containing protein n=1 Tax=Methylocella sp. TaxID=1978226 RepID=UPI003783DFE0